MALKTNEAALTTALLTRTAVATTAETSFHSPTNVVTLLNESDNTVGARITSLYAIARAAISTACNCQVYKKVGSTYTLIDSMLMAVHTPAAAVRSEKVTFTPTLTEPWELQAGEGLAVAIGQNVTNGVTFRAQGGFYENA